ncbi:hypothetical protein DR996_22765 [Vibrio owensii]|nr:hypothetical protein DR996_22765 [Vibrio owensii]
MEHKEPEQLATLAVRNDLFDEVVNNAYVKAVDGLPYPLTRKQEQGIMNALDNSIATITGGAGTGKTTVLRTALLAFKNLGYHIHALAFQVGQRSVCMKASAWKPAPSQGSWVKVRTSQRMKSI